MSHRRLLSLFCLSVLFLVVAQLTRAGGDLDVNEKLTRFVLHKDRAEVFLAVENTTGETRNASVRLELLDRRGAVVSETTLTTRPIAPGSQTLQLNLPPFVADVTKFKPRELIWYRLRYRLVTGVRSSISIYNGIISLSEITPDLFELRVASSEVLREGARYQARVQAIHPLTRHPAAGVHISGEISFEDAGKLNASAVTDKDGYALLNYALPPGLPPTARAELHFVGTRDGGVAEAEGEVLLDNLVRTLITTDKLLYQPGQTIHVRALLFSPTQRALADQNVVIRIADSEGTNVFVTTAKSSRFGVVNADWSVPDNVRLGTYRISVEREGESYQANLEVRISRYELPNFTVSVEPDRPFYLPGQNAKVKVRAEYLFGPPVKKGDVRVVRETSREWNFREQKWDIDDDYEEGGATDADGVFVAEIDLGREHNELEYSKGEQFRDSTYVAYCTDPTTNRTEQRRFTLRVTKEAIHVYIIRNTSDSSHGRGLPLPFYVSTFYADGSPARAKVDFSLFTSTKEEFEEEGSVRKLQRTVLTNRYGLAKAGISFRSELAGALSFALQVRATDARGRSGSANEHFVIDAEPGVFVETQKSLYRAGEPIVASITSTLPDQVLVVDLAKDSSVIRSERVPLRSGRATVSFPYRPDLSGKLTIAAYQDFAKLQRLVGIRTILYPQHSELDLNVRTSQASYRPGGDATVRFNVRAANGLPAESALGVVVSDKAVDERLRTDAEFGGRYQPHNETLRNLLGVDEQLSGVTLRDLQRLDMSKPVSPDLDLLAEVLLNQYRNYSPFFFDDDDDGETELAKVFGSLIDPQMKRILDALKARYERTVQHPTDEKTLRQFLKEERVAFDEIYDPWGVNYRAVFTRDRHLDVLQLMCAGPDKRFETADDFSVLWWSWNYFGPVGLAIQKATEEYHKRTNAFIRGYETLRQELARVGVSLDQLRDPSSQPYRFEFPVGQSKYFIQITSSGPDRKFSRVPSQPEDDFWVWTAEIDYFAESKQKIDKILKDRFNATGKYPENESELREALRDTDQSLDRLRDPWNHPYSVRFTTSLSFDARVARTTGSWAFMSSGADGKDSTVDDFVVAYVYQVIAEQPRSSLRPDTPAPSLEFSNTTGAIYGAVYMPYGGGIGGATISATRTPDIHRYTTTSNSNGEYVLKDLPPGVYEVRVTARGYKTSVITNVQVLVSQFTRIEVSLDFGEVTETVTVTDSGPSVMDSHTPSVSGGKISTPRLRQYFPETLVWQPSIETDGRGRAELKFKLADNITTWKMAVIGSAADGRIGTAETEFKAFQPFFVEHDPPRVLTEGDEISLPVVVRNYLDRPQRIDVVMTTQNWFSMMGSAHKQTAVGAGDAVRQTFDFRVVRSVDDARQRVTALAGNANDAIEKPVTVHPDGEELSVTAGDLLTGSASLELNVPENVIPNSTRAELKIYPNLMAHVIEGVEAIMERPYGCGEQTISSTYPSLLLLRNYKKTGDDFPLRPHAQQYLNRGYNRLLNYRDESGGFAYWDQANPDIALTAYAIRFLSDASGLIAVDHDVLKRARAWLIEQQAKDGSWPPHQVGYTDELQDGKRALLTAYVARILAATERTMPSATNDDSETQARAAVTASSKRALEYLGERSKDIDEPYFLASYALTLIELRDAARAKPIVDKLRSIARNEGVGTYWSQEAHTPFYGWGRAGSIETTALVVQALSRYCGLAEGKCDAPNDANANANGELIKRDLLFLLKQKDRYGVWYSTQATINVFDALLTLSSANTAGRGSGAEAQIELNGRVVQTVKLPATRGPASPITVPIASFLAKGKNRIEIKRPEGGTFSSVQARADYYVPWTDKTEKNSSLRFVTTFDNTETEIGDTITCHVEAERLGFNDYGMLLAEIGLPPGADVDRSSLETALQDWTITQYDILPDRILLYLWPRGGGVKLDFQFRSRFGIAAKTAPSVLYDYYNPDARVIVPPVKFRVK
jgi:A-macroglobulin TED domain/Alpha-2-macroglobulin family/MG2 domain/Carboxypeptidase regulatory-like domain/A-macroglobulin receptor binding domain/Macroglobulin domain MG3